MKKILLVLVIFCTLTVTANAQLGTPTTNVRDTFKISNVYYNGTELHKTDWPDTIIMEDALNVYIANHVYVKGKLIKNVLNDYEFDATCNGKPAQLKIKKYLGGREYVIDGYRFVSSPLDKISQQISDIDVMSIFSSSKDGVSFTLLGRSAVELPSPKVNTDKEGKIVVKIWVDRNGRVTRVSAPEKGSTLTDLAVVSQAKAAARKAKFNARDIAPESQTGTITYVFKNN